MNDKRGSLHSIWFAGGGTAGHIFPGIAVAQRLAELLPRPRITFLGAGKAGEREAVHAAGFAYRSASARPMARRVRDLVPWLMSNLGGYFAARQMVRRGRPSLVVGLGGYASVPTAQAAADCGVPLVLLEQNAIPGKATRWLARAAAVICTSFPEAATYLPKSCRIVYTGNPLRAEFARAQRDCSGCDEEMRVPIRRRLAVLGGSGGARSLNQQVPRVLRLLGQRLAGWEIVHQSGHAEHQATQRLYQQMGLNARVVPFVSNVAALLAETNLAVCRAGGSTLAELAAMGVPALLVPYPQAADDHQRANALAIHACGGAALVDERQPGPPLDQRLATQLGPLLVDAARRAEMAAAMRGWAKAGAAAEVAGIVCALLESTDSLRAAPSERRAA